MHVGSAEGCEVEHRGGPALAGPRGEFGRRVGSASGDEEEDGRLVPDVVEEVFDDRQCSGVGVVQVVEDEQAALPFPDDGEQAQHRFGDHEVRRGVGVRVPGAGQQPGHDRPVAAEFLRGGQQARPGQQEERLDQRPVRDG